VNDWCTRGIYQQFNDTWGMFWWMDIGWSLPTSDPLACLFLPSLFYQRFSFSDIRKHSLSWRVCTWYMLLFWGWGFGCTMPCYTHALGVKVGFVGKEQVEKGWCLNLSFARCLWRILSTGFLDCFTVWYCQGIKQSCLYPYFHMFYFGVVFCRWGYSSHCELDERSEGGSGCMWVKWVIRDWG